VGVQSEAQNALAGLHQLLRRVPNHVEQLPNPQCDAVLALGTLNLLGVLVAALRDGRRRGPLPVARDPPGGRVEVHRFQDAGPRLRGSGPLDQAGPLEYLQVLGDRLLREPGHRAGASLNSHTSVGVGNCWTAMGKHLD
jgi:hypothetical protein